MDAIDISSGSLDTMLVNEWLVTNRLGGYASSTIPCCNTRKYHGLLVAAMNPPVGRMVLLSRVEETVFYDGWPYALACNEYPDTIFPMGYRLLRAFSTKPFPRWAYQDSGWTLEKQLRLLNGQNTVLLSYTLQGSTRPIELELRPLLALRNFHELMYQWNGNLMPQSPLPGLHHIAATHRTPELFFAHDGKFAPEGYWYLNNIYRREVERGYSGLEDLWSPGTIRYVLEPGQTVHFACSTEPLELGSVVDAARQQFRSEAGPLVEGETPDRDLELLERAAGQFVVQDREGAVRLASGYPWAAPSGRDAMISLPGLLLVTGKLRAAKETLEYYAKLANKGLMPAEFPTDGSAPRYQSADTSLWFINSLLQYLRYSGDEPGAQRLFEVVDEILRSCEAGTSLGVRADAEGLLLSGAAGIPTTWMNAQLGDVAVTPRHGRAVEVNALWYNALRIGAHLASRFHRSVRAEELYTLANKCRHAFNRRFWNPQAGCCFDVVGEGGNDPAVRPNQVLAVSLPYPVLEPQRHEGVLTRIREELLIPMGLRTLSPNDPNYQRRYGGAILSRDRAYHQGSAFPWLLGPFVTAMVRVYGGGEQVRSQAFQLLRPCIEHLRGRGMGQLHELFDGDAPHHPGGLPASARSVAEILRAYAEDVLQLGPGMAGGMRCAPADSPASAPLGC